MSVFRIAMDGPVAAGKGTVARLVANRLNFLYVDTGAMYRMVAYLALEAKVNLEDEVALCKLIEKSTMDMQNPTEAEKDGRLTTVILNGEDVSWKIRTEQISVGASKVAQFPKVRAALVKQQQKIAQTQSVVMEGRDITFRVLPEAELKVFLTASDIVRAKRRYQELQTRGQDVEFESVYKDLLERDQRDMQREVDPLHITSDAWVLDTSDLEIEKVVDSIEARVKVTREHLTRQK
ncbi:MAG: (d)CMP kinase [Patescibacteria group bacterium]